jgi:hypothetical protein
MDPVRNPFVPGAGTPPPELAGRTELLQQVEIRVQRLKIGRPERGFLLTGLRGVGKTVLLEQFRKIVLSHACEAIRIEAPENRSLPALIAPPLREVLLKFNRLEAAKSSAKRALQAIAGFAKLKVSYGDLEVGIDFEAEPGLADNGDLQHDLTALLVEAGIAAKSANSALFILIDEIQYVAENELEALIMALHRISQDQLPVMLIGAGLPQLRGQMGKAKSYAERLFEFPHLGPLNFEDASAALQKPVAEEGRSIDSSAINEIFRLTEGYPYFIQEWGKQSWDIAEDPTIFLQDVVDATPLTLAALDSSFFLVRFDRCSPAEKRYLRAMAELGEGPHRSGEIATVLGKEVNSLGPIRNNLISKGMVYSPSHGDTSFTVPLFGEFMKRIMPGQTWK